MTAAITLPAALLLAATAGAQSLPDPTQPPTALRASIDAAPAAATPKLQMILRDRGEVLRALIDGQWLRAGDALTGSTARVVRITETTVALARGGEIETLDLLPAAARRAVSNSRPQAGLQREETK